MDNLEIMNRWAVRDRLKTRVIISMCVGWEWGVNQAQIMRDSKKFGKRIKKKLREKVNN